MGILVSILTALVNALIQIWKNRQPSELVVEAEKAGATNQALKTVENQNAALQNEVRSVDDAASRISTDDGLRNYEATDPYNRDNAGR